MMIFQFALMVKPVMFRDDISSVALNQSKVRIAAQAGHFEASLDCLSILGKLPKVETRHPIRFVDRSQARCFVVPHRMFDTVRLVMILGGMKKFDFAISFDQSDASLLQILATSKMCKTPPRRTTTYRSLKWLPALRFFSCLTRIQSYPKKGVSAARSLSLRCKISIRTAECLFAPKF